MAGLKETDRPCMFDSSWVCGNCFWEDLNRVDIAEWVRPAKRNLVMVDPKARRYWTIRTVFDRESIDLTEANLSRLLFGPDGYYDVDIYGKRFWVPYSKEMRSVAKKLADIRRDWIIKNDNNLRFTKCPVYRDWLTQQNE